MLLKYFKNMSLFGKIRFIICFVLAISCVFVILIGQLQIEDLQTQYNANEYVISGLEHDLSNVTKESQATADTVVINKALVSCEGLGEKVANYQNEYQKYRDEKGEDKRQEIANNLDIYFADDSRNARVEWYSSGNSNDSWTWTFESNYSFTATSIPVLWTCRLNDTNALLAYATGTYDTTIGVFSNVHWYNTTVGASLVTATNERTGDN